MLRKSELDLTLRDDMILSFVLSIYKYSGGRRGTGYLSKCRR